MRNARVMALLLLLVAADRVSAQQQQRKTIPESVAAGAIGSVATVPSGQLPKIHDLLKNTDLVLRGTVGESKSYLSDDKLNVYTDYTILDPIILYESHLTAVHTLGAMPHIVVTRLGGTIVINGVNFTQTEPALPPLATGIKALFLLQREGEKLFPAGKYLGVFDVTNDGFRPLVSREDFAPEYRSLKATAAEDEIIKSIHSLRR
jgi:hypothetical protein